MQVTLGIPMAQLTIDGFDKPGDMETLICDTINELNNGPGKYKDPQVQPRKPGMANPVTDAGADKPPIKKGPIAEVQRICTPHRESSVSEEKWGQNV